MNWDAIGAELASLDNEIEALRADDRRRPWQDGLPQPSPSFFTAHRPNCNGWRARWRRISRWAAPSAKA